MTAAPGDHEPRPTVGGWARCQRFVFTKESRRSPCQEALVMNGLLMRPRARVNTDKKKTSGDVEGIRRVNNRDMEKFGEGCWFCTIKEPRVAITDKQVAPEEGYRVLGPIIYSKPLTEHLLMSFSYNDLLKASNRAKSEPVTTPRALLSRC